MLFTYWNFYVLIAKVQSISPPNNATTTSTPNDYYQSDGFIVPMWLLWSIVITYWMFLFLFCCCRLSQRDQRYTHQAETECCLFSVECCECMAQCIEDCGKGQISNMEKGGKHDLNEGKVLKITDFKKMGCHSMFKNLFL